MDTPIQECHAIKGTMMTNRRKRSSAKNNRQAFLNLLQVLESHGALKPAQMEGVERVRKLEKAFYHALDISDVKEAKLLLGQISKEVFQVFMA